MFEDNIGMIKEIKENKLQLVLNATGEVDLIRTTAPNTPSSRNDFRLEERHDLRHDRSYIVNTVVGEGDGAEANSDAEVSSVLVLAIA